MILAALALAAAPLQAPVDAIAAKRGFAGEILIARDGRIELDRAYGTVAPGGTERHKVGARWRLASITKQVTAVQVLQAYEEDGDLRVLDAPLPMVLFPKLKGVTLRQLLTHHSGLANPDDTPKDAAGVPAAYLSTMPPFEHCFLSPASPGSAFAYNNCDYVVAGIFRGNSRPGGWPAGMTMARPNETGMPGFIAGKPEPRLQLASFGAAGGLIGTARAVFDFDRQLMTGKLLRPYALTELWKPEGNGSAQALGQWVFQGKLAGCALPKRIVQRDGEIGGVQTRNFILPADDLVVVVFTNRSSEDFPLGEVWEGKGFTYDLLSAAACA